MCTEITEEADETLKAAIEGEYLADARRGGREVGEVCERIEEW